MELTEYLQKQRQRVMAVFDLLNQGSQDFVPVSAAVSVKSDRDGAIALLKAELESLSNVEATRIFPTFERHELLREWTLEMRNRFARIVNLENELDQVRFAEERFTQCLDQIYHEVIHHFETLEKDLLPLAYRVLTRDEIQSINAGMSEELGRARPSAAA